MPDATNSQDKPNETDSQDKKADPNEAWREMRDVYLDAWSKAMIETVNSEAYGRANGAMLETYLQTTSPFRMAMEKRMSQILQQLKIPSGEDFASLFERFTNMEMRLDDMDAKLDRIGQFLSTTASAQPTPPKPPAKTRKQRKVAKP